MHLSKSFALKMARSAGVCLTLLAALNFVDSVVLAQAAATPKVNPERPSRGRRRRDRLTPD